MYKFDFTNPQAQNEVKKCIDKEVEALEGMQNDFSGFSTVFEGTIEDIRDHTVTQCSHYLNDVNSSNHFDCMLTFDKSRLVEINNGFKEGIKKCAKKDFDKNKLTALICDLRKSTQLAIFLEKNVGIDHTTAVELVNAFSGIKKYHNDLFDAIEVSINACRELKKQIMDTMHSRLLSSIKDDNYEKEFKKFVDWFDETKSNKKIDSFNEFKESIDGYIKKYEHRHPIRVSALKKVKKLHEQYIKRIKNMK